MAVSGENLISLSKLRLFQEILKITEAIFSFTFIFTLPEYGNTSVYQALFLCEDFASRKTV